MDYDVDYVGPKVDYVGLMQGIWVKCLCKSMDHRDRVSEICRKIVE